MICCVTGHRPKGFPFDYDDRSGVAFRDYQKGLESAVECLIQEGYDYFICGMAQGADLDFAETVIRFKKRYKRSIAIRLEAAIPCPNQTKYWGNYDRKRYQRILKKCDKQTLVSPVYQSACMQLRNQYMVDRSALVFAIWNGKYSGGTWNTIRYAKEQGKTIRFLML